MAEITMREIENDEYVQHAELRIPIEKLALPAKYPINQRDCIVNALAFIADVKRIAFEFFEVDDDNADYTSFEYKGFDGDVLVVEVAQVNV